MARAPIVNLAPVWFTSLGLSGPEARRAFLQLEQSFPLSNLKRISTFSQHPSINRYLTTTIDSPGRPPGEGFYDWRTALRRHLRAMELMI